MNQNQNHPWEHLLLTAFHHSQVLVCQHLMGTTNITQALLKVTEGGFVSKIFDLISLRTEEWKTGWTEPSSCRKSKFWLQLRKLFLIANLSVVRCKPVLFFIRHFYLSDKFKIGWNHMICWNMKLSLTFYEYSWVFSCDKQNNLIKFRKNSFQKILLTYHNFI